MIARQGVNHMMNDAIAVRRPKVQFNFLLSSSFLSEPPDDLQQRHRTWFPIAPTQPSAILGPTRDSKEKTRLLIHMHVGSSESSRINKS